ncbi:hypothetical protein CTAYLR_006648 [Chrysophaeum taylorii]|uniref:Uncharacterized protein n=1 Tax=Chrysophaeum taylorii TaxID=2483200 RepID=A0AAD7UK60_9STRA|nr:hypothetical protein CTAYLR_006648 [Chrysophaeum taylorii]
MAAEAHTAGSGESEEKQWSIPLRRRNPSFFGTTDSMCSTPPAGELLQRERKHINVCVVDDGPAKSWLKALSTHPLITVVAGIAQIFGLGRVASSLSAVSLSSLHSADIDNFEEYDIMLDKAYEVAPTPSSTDSSFGYGFYVAITPPHQPDHAAERLTGEGDVPTGIFASLRAKHLAAVSQ